MSNLTVQNQDFYVENTLDLAIKYDALPSM
jgi:hypothetical protein